MTVCPDMSFTPPNKLRSNPGIVYLPLSRIEHWRVIQASLDQMRLDGWHPSQTQGYNRRKRGGG